MPFRSLPMEKVFDTLVEGVAVFDPSGRITMVNSASERILGAGRETIVGLHYTNVPWRRAQAEGDLPPERHPFARVLAGEERIEGEEFDIVAADGRRTTIQVNAAALREEGGAFAGMVATYADVGERKRAEQRIHYLNTHDALTDLSNRLLFAGRVEQAIEAAAAARGRFAVLAAGLDRFASINDSLGRDSGDEVLKAVAGRIAVCMGAAEVVARPGGDEFLVLLEHAGSPQLAHSSAESIRAAVASPLHLDGRDVVVTLSAGLAMYPGDGDAAGSLLRSAGTALGAAKAAGGDCVRFFDAQMNVAARARFEAEGELRRALDRDELELHYQPQVDLATRAIVGWEALVRWRHPQRGLLMPAQFLPIAESSGLVVPLGERVMLKACRQAACWARSGMPSARIAVNVSAQQFRHPGFMKAVHAALAASGVDPALMELEIVEDALIGHEPELRVVFEALRDAGIQLSLDDFGTGYSSLSYLQRLPFDTVKIDASFVREVPARPQARAIVQAIVALAHGLGLGVIAEGIDSPAQLEFLLRAGCERGQGYLLGRPEPAGHWSGGSGRREARPARSRP